MIVFSLLCYFCLYLCPPAHPDEVSISSESVSSLRRPDLEIARYEEYARVTRELGHVSRSEIEAEISAIVDAPSADDHLGNALDSKLYLNLVSECRLRIDAGDRRSAHRIQTELFVPEGHVMYPVWRDLYQRIVQM